MNITKRCIIFFTFFLLPASVLFAQPDIAVDTTNYLDSELYEEEASVTYSWLGGGFYIGYLMPDLTDFNKNISQPFVGKDVDERVLLFGGRGFMPFPFVRNLRVGGLGYGGVTERCCVDDTASQQPVTRSLKYSIGYGALTIDYALPIAVRRMFFLLGVELGLGGIDIEAKQAAKRVEFDIRSEFDNPSTNITHTYSSGFFLLKPQLQIEWAPSNFLMLQLAAGYQTTFMGDWKVDGDVELGNTDALSNINGSGPVVNFGVNIGFFHYWLKYKRGNCFTKAKQKKSGRSQETRISLFKSSRTTPLRSMVKSGAHGKQKEQLIIL